MRIFLLFVFSLPFLAFGQLCSEASPVSYSGFGSQFSGSDLFDDADYLDALNVSSYWSLGTGISDNNLTVHSNNDITSFLGVKKRYSVAPNDNVASSGNNFYVEPGYSAASQYDPTLTGPESNWNILMYVGLENAAFDSVDVTLWIDFDPCFDSNIADMYSINIGEAFDANPFTQSEDFSSFGINTNLGDAAISSLNPDDSGFDATAEGYYTFAIEVKDNCGNQKLWNEITVFVQDAADAGADANSNGIYDNNEVVGCQNVSACNYDCAATTNSGCDYTSCSGCTVMSACNYNAAATIPDAESCNYPIDLYGGAHYNCDGSCVIDTDGDGVCDEDEETGCIDAAACNYDDTANLDEDAGACTYAASNADCAGDCVSGFVNVSGTCVAIVEGCIDSAACNYDNTANTDDSSCESTSCGACKNSDACNYNNGSGLIHDSLLCVFASDACDTCSGDTDGTGTVVDNDSDNDGVCDASEVVGCQTNTACNYNANATDSGTCLTNDALGVCGGSCSADVDGDGICDDSDLCTDTSACNYNDSDNEACESLSCAGCTLALACNYDSSATISSDTCVYSGNCDSCSGAQDGSGTVVDGDTDNDGVCDVNEVYGCTDNTQCNYNPLATESDDSCLEDITGCTIPIDCNYNPSACTHLHSMCSPSVGGSTACSGGMQGNPPPLGMITTCDNSYACNYEEEGACEYSSCVGCMSPDGCDYSVDNLYNAPCDYSCYGCTNVNADNYDTENPATIDDGSCVISGCTTAGACNYDETANNDDGTCDFLSCVGCNEPTACNYDSSVTLNEPISCIYSTPDVCDSCSGESDGTGVVVDGDTDNDGVCNAEEIDGCTDGGACNFNSSATEEDGTCQYLDACDVCDGSGVDTDGDGVCDANEISGCTNLSACNYNSSATDNTGCDFTSCEGCMDNAACNYDDTATTNVPSQCQYPADLYGASHFDCSGACLNDTDSDGTCDEDEVAGCTDSDACNYNAAATDDDNSCTSPASIYVDCSGDCIVDEDEDGVCDPLEVYGCTTTSACNYDSVATENDGSCEFSSCAGCTIESACNYDATATLSNNLTCTYIPEGWDDCDETICTDSDNDGNCDFDEVEGCVGDFEAPHIILSGVIDVDSSVADWNVVDYTTSITDAIGVDGAASWVDYPGRLADGRYSVTRIYSASDVCGNSSEAGQLLIADESHASGCTDANATSYDPAAVNDDGSCDYSPACLGDLNLDNIIGTSDLLILLSAFGLDCPE